MQACLCYFLFFVVSLCPVDACVFCCFVNPLSRCRRRVFVVFYWCYPCPVAAGLLLVCLLVPDPSPQAFVCCFVYVVLLIPAPLPQAFFPLFSMLFVNPCPVASGLLLLCSFSILFCYPAPSPQALFFLKICMLVAPPRYRRRFCCCLFMLFC